MARSLLFLAGLEEPVKTLATHENRLRTLCDPEPRPVTVLGVGFGGGSADLGYASWSGFWAIF